MYLGFLYMTKHWDFIVHFAYQLSLGSLVVFFNHFSFIPQSIDMLLIFFSIYKSEIKLNLNPLFQLKMRLWSLLLVEYKRTFIINTNKIFQLKIENFL